MKRLIIFNLLIIYAIFMIVGCAGQNISKISEGVNVVEEIPKDQRLADFNDALGKITDESSAQSALQKFVDYVDTRVAKKNNVHAREVSGEILSDKLIKKLAVKEVAATKALSRGEKISRIGITPRKIATTINSLTKEGQMAVSEKLVNEVQAKVRKALPNLASVGGETVKPIEALVIGYAIHTGDDGGAGPSTVTFEASSNQIQTFVEKILQ